MTPETMLLSALSAVTSVLCVIGKLLWAKSEKYEVDRILMHIELEKLKESIGTARGTLISFERCPETECPFRSHVKEQAVR